MGGGSRNKNKSEYISKDSNIIQNDSLVGKKRKH